MHRRACSTPVYILTLAILANVPGKGTALTAAPDLDLTNATVAVHSRELPLVKKAANMLVEEVAKRTQIRWSIADRIETPVIIRLEVDSVQPHECEISTNSAQGPLLTVKVSSNNERGMLYAVGHLLRAMDMQKGKITLPASFRLASTPRYPLRGHQLGYRPKTNSYDGWSLPMWEQYIRDLIVFGCNAIELIPPRSDDAATSPHFPLPPMEMMVGMSQLLKEYGLEVWIWYPAMDKDYSNPKTVEFALNEWGAVFKKLPKIDAIFVPGGDPGHTQPRHLMALLEKQTENLQRYHPRAQMWVSPQSFDKAWMDEFLGILKTEPAWLSGIVYGPQVRMTLPQLRSLVPKRYPIRHYPDITHSLRSQYPVPDWDAAFGVTAGREGINPRPRDQAAIFRLTQPDTHGFITYSEGCNDDVNKVVFSALGWNPDADVVEILRDYGRYFIGPAYADRFAQGLLALENNWRGPVLTNRGIETTLQQFQEMERSASPSLKLNWRFQQALYRAYYDAYIRSRLIHETQLEDATMNKLRTSRTAGSQLALTQAEGILDRAGSRRVAGDHRARAFELAEALFQSIRMQLSVPRYQAISVGRGATLDTIDTPLNNWNWLKDRFAEIRKLATEAERLRQIDAIVNWTNPGPGGFYDDLGNPSAQPHLVAGKAYASDPAYFESPLCFLEDRPIGRKSWWDQAIAFYDLPLKMRYTGLDRAASYKLRVVYGAGPIRCLANERVEIHPQLSQRFTPIEFDIPASTTSSGELRLSWFSPPGAGSTGRGCQVAEVWLIRK